MIDILSDFCRPWNKICKSGNCIRTSTNVTQHYVLNSYYNSSFFSFQYAKTSSLKFKNYLAMEYGLFTAPESCIQGHMCSLSNENAFWATWFQPQFGAREINQTLKVIHQIFASRPLNVALSDIHKLIWISCGWSQHNFSQQTIYLTQFYSIPLNITMLHLPCTWLTGCLGL